MFAELEKVMDFSIENDSFLESLNTNITGKKSNSGVGKTATYLKRLYTFDTSDNAFNALKHFWQISDSTEKRLLAFIYAINNDNLLADSINVVCSRQPGEKVTIESFDVNIDKFYPNAYSSNTRKSMAQNIASSWKQAGFIEGKSKNIRTEPAIKPLVAAFAFLMAYLNGDRGEFIWGNIGVKALCLTESRLKELAIECAKRDLMQYQYAGNVTAIAFNNVLKKIGIEPI